MQGFPPSTMQLTAISSHHRILVDQALKPPGMQLKPENQTDNKLYLFQPAKNPKSQHKVLSVRTRIATTTMSNGKNPVYLQRVRQQCGRIPGFHPFNA